MKQKIFYCDDDRKSHWLDCCEEKFGANLVKETKMVLNVLTLFVPLPLFWALYTQYSSRWVFQASRMNGDIGWYTIKPDQMVMSTTLFIIILIPVFERVIFPILLKFGLKSPLQKMTCGLICAALSFIIAALVEWKIKDNQIHMLWLIPQFFTIAVAEIFLWVPNVSFVYSQAPESMKCVMTAFMYFTIAIGSLIVIVVSGTHFIKSQLYEFLFYAILMLLNSLLFVILAKNYKYVEHQ